MCVPFASAGGFARAASIALESSVNGSTTVVSELKTTTASFWSGFRAFANARAAANASSIGSPRMLLLASMTSTIDGVAVLEQLHALGVELLLPRQRDDVGPLGEPRVLDLAHGDALVRSGRGH